MTCQAADRLGLGRSNFRRRISGPRVGVGAWACAFQTRDVVHAQSVVVTEWHGVVWGGVEWCEVVGSLYGWLI